VGVKRGPERRKTPFINYFHHSHNNPTSINERQAKKEEKRGVRWGELWFNRSEGRKEKEITSSVALTSSIQTAVTILGGGKRAGVSRWEQEEKRPEERQKKEVGLREGGGTRRGEGKKGVFDGSIFLTIYPFRKRKEGRGQGMGSNRVYKKDGGKKKKGTSTT